jgi:hypothetical protein
MLSSFKGELKQQGAEEAARDPNTSVSAEDAERVILNESKKAGAVALQFDPNASPEEKAAQARSVSLCPLFYFNNTHPVLENGRHQAASQGYRNCHRHRKLYACQARSTR